ncbi:MAG: metallophosphoesterase [Eubacteriales bacterium]
MSFYKKQFRSAAALKTCLFPGRAAQEKHTGSPVSETDIEENRQLVRVSGIEKDPNHDFRILNITDLHMSDTGYRYKINPDMLKTLEILIKETKPDLITVTGDIVCGDAVAHSVRRFTDFMESFDTPWAPVFGNHDDEANCDLSYLADIMLAGPHCIMKKGDPEMGVGNYIVPITENGRIVEVLFMLDSHHGLVNQKQTEWLSSMAAQLHDACGDDRPEAAVFMHIPTAEFEYAYNAAYDSETRTFRDAYCAVGEKHEPVCCEKRNNEPYEEGFFGVLKDTGIVKHVFCGHDHMNDFSVLWDGIRLTYTMKVGKASGCQPGFDGGTLLTLDSRGIRQITHKTRENDDSRIFYDIETIKLR